MRCVFASTLIAVLYAVTSLGVESAIAQTDSDTPSIALADNATAWVVELSKIQGFTGRVIDRIAVASTGEVRCGVALETCESSLAGLVARIDALSTSFGELGSFSDHRVIFCSDCDSVILRVHRRDVQGIPVVSTLKSGLFTLRNAPPVAGSLYSLLSTLGKK